MSNHPINDVAIWDALAPVDRLAAARAVAASLPPEFQFESLATCELGGVGREVAFFRVGDARFALIPGSPNALLGYDRAHPFVASPAQSGDWESSTKPEWGVSLDEYLDECMTPVRRACVEPMLVEVKSQPHEYDQDGARREGDYARVAESCGEGFRLPTADEWEYACAAGTRSLFRWGNDCPISSSDTERSWDLHKRPNAFGLQMNADTYDIEICQGPVFRGGDGGGAVHGGIGHVTTWLPLASWFCLDQFDVDGWCIEWVMVRRVRTVSL